MEEYTNRELGLLIKEIGTDVKDLKKAIFGNGKPGILDRMQNLEAWKAMLIGGFSVVSLLIVPIAIKVFFEWIKK